MNMIPDPPYQREPARILQVVIGPYPAIRGGVDRMVRLLIEDLQRSGCRISVFVPGEWKDRRLSRRIVEGVDVYTRWLPVPTSGQRPVRDFLRWCVDAPGALLGLLRVCRRDGIDLIHVHTATNYLFYFRLLRLIGGPPYLLTFHRGDVVDFQDRRRIDRTLIRWGVAGAKASNAVSRWLAQEARHVFEGLCDPVHVYNGIAAVVPAPHRTAPPPASPYFLTVGSFDPYKGHDIAIRAWGLLRRSHPELRLLLVGEGDLRPDYLRLIEESGCSDTVELTGQLPHDEVQALLSGAVGMVFPSRNEGFGYVILEAGLAGIPVVCSDIAPLNEIVVDGESGLLFPSEDSAALAAAVERLLDDDDLRLRLASKLRRRAETDFSAETMARRYKALYDRILDQTRAS